MVKRKKEREKREKERKERIKMAEEPEIYNKFTKCCKTCSQRIYPNINNGFGICMYTFHVNMCIMKNFRYWKHKDFICDYCGKFNKSSNNEKCCYCGSK